MGHWLSLGTKDNGESSYKLCGSEILPVKIQQQQQKTTQGISNLHLYRENTVYFPQEINSINFINYKNMRDIGFLYL